MGLISSQLSYPSVGTDCPRVVVESLSLEEFKKHGALRDMVCRKNW